ncbi:Baseplate J-like protein [Paenibacillus konkukensis]|uniref:Baseplate J-like protein n=1 Tax=Paenibacillus konkukensis TaxID=2020716 RepID=A0ABY4RME6_9BACL|nr:MULTISPECIES: baseplate J/gp47 family protein [Paenibacillus]PZM63653.1 baseplate J family protein [Paenibacillus dendritiformis]UQZ83333.1 Baseplate J-like protein [Paenibacillus konkukensis]
MADLPPFLEDQLEEVIRQRMLDRMPADLDKTEGSIPWDAISPVSIELVLASEWAKEVLRRAFVQTTFGDYLTYKADENGVRRRPAEYARTAGDDVLFVGDPGSPVPAGYLVTTESTEATPAKIYETLAAVTTGQNGEARVAVRAVEAGRIGNAPIGAIRHLTESLPGIKSVTNLAPVEGGVDEEDDETLRERVLEENRREEGDGNISDYVAWAKQIPGVGNVLVEPLWQGEGTVRVIILDLDGRPAPQPTIDAVQEHLDPGSRGIGEGLAPTGSRVTVHTATTTYISATIPGLVPEPGYTVEQARLNAETALNAYLFHVNPGGVIKIQEAAASVINAPGVDNMGDILLEGSRQDIYLEVNELAQLGSVDYP